MRAVIASNRFINKKGLLFYLKIVACVLLLLPSVSHCQMHAKINYYKVVADIWSRLYLFHSLSKTSEKEVNYDEILKNTLHQIKNVNNQKDLCELLNQYLFGALGDNLCFSTYGLAQRSKPQPCSLPQMVSERTWYWNLKNPSIIDKQSFFAIDSVLSSCSIDTFIVDLRLKNYMNNVELLKFLIKEPIQLGSKASVVYEGWNEGGLMGYNYQRKWSVEQSRWIYPITQQKDFEESSKKLKLFQANTIVILTNAYSEKQMGDLFDALQYQNGIKTISDNSPLKLPVQTNDQYLDSINVQFNLENFLSLNGGMGFDPDTSLEIGDNVFQILDIIRKSTSYRNNKKRVFDGTTHFKNYQRSFKDSLTHEDKVYALIKLYTILKYFYPFFDEIMLDWDARFVEFIEQCPVSESLPQFYHYLCEFLQPLADSHVTLLFEKINSDYYTLPIKFDKIEGRTVVTEIKHKILPDSLKILKGTELIKINGFAIEDFEKMWLKRISFSTPAAGLRNVYSYHIPPSPINGPFGSEVELTILAPDSLSAKKIYFKRTVSPNEWRTDMVKRPSSYKIQNIGYIDISRIDSIGQYESTIKEMMDTKAIIIDLRKRPTIGSVNKIVSPFIKDTLNVGFEEIPLITSSRMSWIRNEFRFNGNSKIYYKKPLIILINENSQSGTETIASIFKAAKRAVFIGSQTAGTTGALSWIFLDNLGYATFTGCRIGNAEGNLLWQHGIIPDITVKPTLKGIREDKDEVLETAVSYINQNFE